jgi:uncharacterized protein YggE
MLVRSFHLVVIGSLLSGPVAAQRAPSQHPPTITVTAEAVLDVSPDEAEVELGVVTTAKDAQSAGARNARQVSTVVDALRASLGQDAAVETIGYSIAPDRRDPPDGDPAIVGYTAANVVRITLRDLSRVGAAIDRALEAGANHVRRVAFSLRDEEAASARALRQATANARARADAVAGALGVEVGALVSATSGGAQVPRPFDVAMVQTRGSAPVTPIQPGSIEVRATVTLTMAVVEAVRRPPPR